MLSILLVSILLQTSLPAQSDAETGHLNAGTQLERASDQAIIKAYTTASDGYSADEIIINDSLRASWLEAVEPEWKTQNDDWQTQTLLRLLSLRKASKLPAMTTKRGPAVQLDLVPIAEIAARSVLDRYPVSSDVLLCDPRLRKELQTAAVEIASGADAYAIRKAVLRLRKTRKLRPELVLRVTDWDRTIQVYTRQEVEEALRVKPDEAQAAISHHAGVYLFRDSTGYLYIGEAVNLHQRLSQHLHESDRLSLRKYLDSIADGSVTVELHLFGKDSPANDLTIRRAYESELIRSREPRFNLRP